MDLETYDLMAVNWHFVHYRRLKTVCLICRSEEWKWINNYFIDSGDETKDAETIVVSHYGVRPITQGQTLENKISEGSLTVMSKKQGRYRD